MTSFVRRWCSGWAVLAVLAIAPGCQTLPTSCDKGTCASANGHACASGRCGSSRFGGCGRWGCNHCRQDFDYEWLHPDHCWPEQFNRESARRVNEPLGKQVQNGTAIELTLWDHYFSAEEEEEDGENGKPAAVKPASYQESKKEVAKKDAKDEVEKPRNVLNEAGKARLRYLSRKKPYVIPDLYLQMSYDEKLDKERKEAVMAELKKLSKPSVKPVEWTVTMVDREPIGTAPLDAVFATTHAQKFSEMQSGQGVLTITRKYEEPKRR